MASTVIQGAKSGITTSAVALASSPTPFTYGIRLKAAGNNAGNIAVGLAIASGNANVTFQAADATDGWPLSAGGELPVPANVVADLSLIYVIADQAGQRIHWYGE